MTLEDKAVLVTGAGSGLGAAVVMGCVAQGAHVLAVDIDPTGLDATLARARAAGGEVQAFVCDLADPASGKGAVEAAITAFGKLDGACNAAAVLGYHHFGDVTADELTRILTVNIAGAFHLSQAVIPELLKTGGSLVNIGSSGGVIGTAYTIPYSISKAAVMHMTKCLAMEFMHSGIRINCVAPGPMRTNISRDIVKPDGLDPVLMARPSGLRPIGDAAAVAELVVFALSDRARAIHGAILLADSGVAAG